MLSENYFLAEKTFIFNLKKKESDKSA